MKNYIKPEIETIEIKNVNVITDSGCPDKLPGQDCPLDD